MPARALFASVVVCLCAWSVAAAAAGSGPEAKSPAVRIQPGAPADPKAGPAVATSASIVDLGVGAADALRGGAGRGGKGTGDTLRLDNIRVAGKGRVLSLERFHVFTDETQFVVARPGGKGRGGAEWDRIAAPRVTLWRGSIEGEPGSSVVIAAGDKITIGSIDLGAGGDRFRLSSHLNKDHTLPPGSLAVFRAGEGPGRADAAGDASSPASGPASPCKLCGVVDPPVSLKDIEPDGALAGGGEGEDEEGVRGGTMVPRRLRVQLAVDTDFEYYSLFGDVDDAATYIAMLYGQVSDIFLREINVAIELSFVRIWDTPTEPWDVDGDALLGWFGTRWNADMAGVTRDLAQLCSGRRDLPWGGIAYLNGVCNSSSYSCVAYILGSFPDPSIPNSEGYDIMVTAHELGHNFATNHTHFYGIDGCDQITTPARRGTIMSYCSQTVSGGNAVMDYRFETSIKGIMRNYLRQRSCVDRDCNGNGVPDPQDISSGTSLDVNQNSVPDECEDCNGNGRFDRLDIQQGFSFDRNQNGIPDDCEPDCNGNGIVDEFDITSGTSQDVYKDGVPDECQADCDANGVADYNQIQEDMTLDIDRNRVLDGCQDCDSDGVNDLFALDGSRNLWVTSNEHDDVVEFYASTGVRMREATAKGMAAAQDIVITADRRIFVSSGEDDRIIEFDRTGAFVRTLTQGAPLDFPAGLLLTADGTLMVVSRNNASVLEYDVDSGSLVRTVVASGAGGLTEPFALIRTPGGIIHGNELLVSGDDHTVRRYNPSTGAYLGILVTPSSGNLEKPRGMLLLPDGKLLVTSLMTNQALAYSLATGEPLGQWNHNGTNSVLRLLGPWGIKFGPDGNVYIAVNGNQGPTEFDPPPFFRDPLLHVTNTKVFRFDVRNGNYLTSFVIGQDTQLEHAAGLAFMPLGENDCNANQFPDACDIAQGLETDCNDNGLPDSCDIASGAATDYNRNGIPDACECLADWNRDGVVNSTDVSDFINDWFEDQVAGTLITDFNHDGAANSTDVSDFINAYFGGEGKCG